MNSQEAGKSKEIREVSLDEIRLWEQYAKSVEQVYHKSLNQEPVEINQQEVRELEQEEFRNFLKDVQPIKYKERTSKPTPKTIRTLPTDHSGDSDEFYELLKPKVSHYKFYSIDPSSESSKKLRGKLDLHGMTLQEAFRAFEAFILQAVCMSCKRLEIITGVGRSSGGAIRQEVPYWVASRDWGATITLSQNENNPGSVELLLSFKSKS